MVGQDFPPQDRDLTHACQITLVQEGGLRIDEACLAGPYEAHGCPQDEDDPERSEQLGAYPHPRSLASLRPGAFCSRLSPAMRAAKAFAGAGLGREARASWCLSCRPVRNGFHSLVDLRAHCDPPSPCAVPPEPPGS